jgi:hypothetical protein
MLSLNHLRRVRCERTHLLGLPVTKIPDSIEHLFEQFNSAGGEVRPIHLTRGETRRE